jgi:antitoxin (DNA-binding transcriptional repressor) of toxin-antitoxin stability system
MIFIMSTVHITEAEVLQNPAALLAYVRAGAEVVIEDEQQAIGRVYPQVPATPTGDPAYDAWFIEQVDEALASDPATDIDGDVVEAQFAERRRLSMFKAQERIR